MTEDKDQVQDFSIDTSQSVILFELTNLGGTATLKFTSRAAPDEELQDHLDRVKTFIGANVPGADLAFEFKDITARINESGGKRGKKKMFIKDNQFALKSLKRTETKKVDDKSGKPWSILIASGEDAAGNKVQAGDFLGSDYVNKDSPTAKFGKLDKVLTWPVDKEYPTEQNLGNVIVKVIKDEQYNNYKIVEFVQAPSVEGGNGGQPPSPFD